MRYVDDVSEPSSLPDDLPRFTPDGVSYRCKRHGWMDAEGGMCPSCVATVSEPVGRPAALPAVRVVRRGWLRWLFG